MKSHEILPRRLACAIAAIVCLVALPLAAGNPTGGVGQAPPSHAAGTIVGTAWRADNSPVPQAKLRLRSLITGRIAGATVADAAGEFRFATEPGTYLVELVNDSGRVLAVGHPFVLMRGETVATFVRVSDREPRFAGFFVNAAAAAIASAASLGVTALGPTAPPVSAKR